MSSRIPEAGPKERASGRRRRTRTVLRTLRRRRTARPSERSGGIAYRVYLAVVGGSLIAVPLATAVHQTLRSGAAPPERAADPVFALPFFAAAALLLVLWSAVYDATVRGAVRIEPAVIDWVLTQPVDRSAVLRPALWRTVAARTALGAVLGLAAIIGLWRFAVPAPVDGAVAPLARAALAGALTGALTATSGAAATVCRRRALAALRPFYYLVLLLFCGAGVQAWASPGPTSATGLVLWSGPWGWASQAFSPPAVSGSAAPWPALLLLAALVAGTLVWSMRTLPRRAHRRQLKAHAAAAMGVRSGFWVVDPNLLHTTFAGSHVSSRYRIRLPPPRRTWLTVPWRDALAALRSPIALLRACLLSAAAVAVAHAPTDPVSTVGLVLTAAVPALHYAAASQLLGAARAEATDPRLARYFPCTPGALGLLHGLVPSALLVAITALSGTAAAVASDTDGHLAVRAVLLALAAVAAALVSVYRGTLPLYLAVGYDTPFGNSAPVQILLWHAAGPASLVALAWPTVSGALDEPWTAALWLLAGTAALAWWARRRARTALDSAV
ncbi:DUF6297 family protein [Streptomonospora salina]|uniref:Uncharacterized protein n=1 Tax=Streptomonospora salina TaxID=104205 RepID=A0A841EB01_9ACTN|nr:DUF6297 family protein [Streptomonospora salina]MBB5998509.1 hypothetical protein [Streptomonospora salina]